MIYNILKSKKNVWLKLTAFLVVLNCFFLQSYLLRFSVLGYRTNLQEFLLFFEILFFFVFLFSEKKIVEFLKNIKRYKVILSFLGLIVFSLINFYLRDISLIDFFRYGKFFVFAFVFALIFLEVFKETKERYLVIELMGIGALAFSFFSLIYNLLGYNVTFDYRLTGPLDSAVYFAYYLAPFCIFFLLNYFEKKEKRYLIFAVLAFLFLSLTRSMASIFFLSLVLLFYFYKRYSKIINKNWKLLIVFLTAFLLICGMLFYSRIIPSIKADSSSFQERVEIWRTSSFFLQDVKTKFFGLGLGQFQPNFEKYAKRALFDKEPLDYNVLQPHNIVLQFWLNFGILGLIFVVYVFCKIIPEIIVEPVNDKFFHISLVRLVVLYFLLHGIIDTPIFKNDLIIVFLLFLELYFLERKKILERKNIKFLHAFISGVIIFSFLFINWIICVSPRSIPYFLNSVILQRQMLFYDVYEGHLHFQAIKYMTESGKMNRYLDDTFRPSLTMNRGEFLSLVLQAASYQNYIFAADNCFSDVSKDTLNSGAICFAKNNGFVLDSENGRFRPDWRISKSEAFSILSKVLNWGIDVKPYSTPDWYKVYADYVKNNKLLDYDWNTFEMWHPITRGEFAEIWFRASFSAS